MQTIEAALGFAITMLVLSLIVSSLVELIHRTCSMREAGLKYVLERMCDQVLKQYLPNLNPESDAFKNFKKSFVDRMSANRAPMGVAPDPTPDQPAGQQKTSGWSFGLWGGRDLTALSTKDFMERLGTIDPDTLGKSFRDANDKANELAGKAGSLAADASDAVLKDIAQKFDALGRNATEYFAGRAKLLSVLVAIGLALAAHVDAVDLYRTYLSDPNARQKVIEQTQSVTAQYKAAADAANALKQVSNAAPAPGTPSGDAIKAQVDKLGNDWQAAIGDVNKTVKQYQDLGTAIGWTEERIKTARMGLKVWTCPSDTVFWTLQGDCNGSENLWFQVPTNPKVYFFLVLGGLLIGLGSPFWYSVVTGLTNVRSVARDVSGANASLTQAAQNAGLPIQPLTPAGTFAAAHVAQASAPSPAIPATPPVAPAKPPGS
jgi:hypothetical protein